MVFSSLIFLWFFLPVIFIGYFITPGRFKNLFLLLGSLIFYTWGEPKYILLMLLSIMFNYCFGIMIDRSRKYRTVLLFLDIAGNIILLGYFKYFNFLCDIFNTCTNFQIQPTDIALPIGISFYTFQALSYIIDLYRGEYRAQYNIINLALYISFFPQLIAGPIVKYKDINEQFSRRTCTLKQTAEGIRRFIYGLAKKVLVANTVAQCVDAVYSLNYSDINGTIAWMGTILYSLQIYYDFSGYSDMAIGLGKLFGFEFEENFNYPYLSSSIQEFWKRWHISLGTWFREYLYIPLGGNRKGTLRTYLNLLIVFFMTGLWHGASFNFIFWGLYHGFFQIIERLGLKNILKKHRIIAHIYTIIVFVFGWILFRSVNLTQAWVMIQRMILPWKYTGNKLIIAKLFEPKTIFITLLSVLGCGLVQIHFKRLNLRNVKVISYLEIIYCGIIFILCISSLASNTYNPFIYFRF